MSQLDTFEGRLEPELRQLFRSLETPPHIQAYLDSIPYVGEELNRSPLRVMLDRQAHCLDGGLFGALALRRLGYPSLILDLVPEPETDDDHVLALFQRHGLWGAVAKSNFVGLRYREPVYRSLRELAMSYFEQFYNLNGKKTLRAYTRPLNLSRFDRFGWMWSEAGVERIVARLYSQPSIPLIGAQSISELAPVDPRSLQAGMQGTNYSGLYQPKKL
jgi:hypothetical protein